MGNSSSMEKTIGIYIEHLLEKKTVNENDIMIIEDSQNTKKITVRDFVQSMVKDDELPTRYRIYSAEKIQNMIDDLETVLTKGIGSMNSALQAMDKQKADIVYVDAIKDALIEEIETKSNSDAMLEMIEAKRDKETKLTWLDFDMSSDEYKIKLQNLSQEVIDSILGGTPIPTNRAPRGGWVYEDIADKAIKFKKLSDDYRYGGHHVEGDINEFIEDGVYTLGANIIGLPKEDPNDKEIRLLTVTRTGNDIIKQVVEYVNDLVYRPIYRRVCTINRLRVTDFIKVEEINDKFQAGRDVLSQSFNNCGVLENCDIFSIEKDGQYLTGEGVLNLPTNDTFLVDIKTFDDRIIREANIINANRCDVYKSLTYYTDARNPVHTQWFNISSYSRSKFEGKTVYLFGDGILFGLGSSDIPNKSIPALLSNKYGLRIMNKALGDATAGNYDDEILTERSVITQVALEPLEDADYAIIMIGTNDWRSGKANLGIHNDFDDMTYRGALNLIIKNIYDKNPLCKILLLSPIFRGRVTMGDSKNSDDYTMNDLSLYEFVETMEDVAKAYHIPFIDLYNTSGIGKYNYTAYLKDGLYLNDNGHDLIADKIMDAMNRFY